MRSHCVSNLDVEGVESTAMVSSTGDDDFEALKNELAVDFIEASEVAIGRLAFELMAGSVDKGGGGRVGTRVRVSDFNGRDPSGCGGSSGGDRTESKSNAVSSSVLAVLHSQSVKFLARIGKHKRK